MKKILIAEDEKSLALTLFRKVSSLGYDCVQARDGEETLKKFKSEKPDLVLLDIVMPYKNGLEILEEIRIREHSKVPIIILSNLGQSEDIGIAKKLNVSEYYIKSNISLKELSIKIHELLS
ncbi:response regulator [Candidatus Woesebacteria bacterium]|nr:response regulator [Candidatus Woesebacteria bacterium]